jgi:hypothetical protein
MEAHLTVFKFAPAKREGVGLFIGIAGGTGSGKTYSALRLAKGIAGGRPVAAIDTEGRRMSHYAGDFSFDVADMLPPFRPERFAQAAKDAEDAGYGVLVIDSFSHEWSGEGGVLAWHDEIKGDDERKNMSAWIKPKVAHKAMVASFLQRRIPIVLCMRAEEKTGVDGRGKPIALGWTPIGDPRFMFELTTMITLANDKPGRVNYDLPRKIQRQHLHLFPDGELIGEDAGAQLAAWARGDDIGGVGPSGKSKAEQAVDALINDLQKATTGAEIDAALAGEKARKQIDWLLDKRPEEHARLYRAVNAHRTKVDGDMPDMDSAEQAAA